MDKPIRPFWPPLAAGIALGLVLLLTFVFTGHGLGATGFTTRLTAWLGGLAVPELAAGNSYLGGLLEDGNPLSSWITWQALGVMLGALLASLSAGRFKLQMDGSRQLGTLPRTALVLLGGILAGFGARLAAGCTSGMGLSGGATLAVAGFLFLGGFFATGLLVSRGLERVRYELTHNGREG